MPESAPVDSSTEPERVIAADWVLPIEGEPIRGGAVRYRGDRITSVGPADSLRRDGLPTLDLGSVVLMPGLVNVHTHLELTLLRGLCEDPDFFTWIRTLTEIKYGPLRVGDFQLAARLGVIELIRAGVTCVGDAGDRGVVAAVLDRAGLRGIAFQEVFGPDAKQAEQAIRGLEKSLDSQADCVSDRLRLGVSPHAPYTVSAELFRRVAALARERRLFVSTHVAESGAEVDFVRRGKGPFAESLAKRGIACEATGLSPVAYLDSLSVLGEQTLVVHGVQVDAEDIEMLRRSATAVAHCPKSNAKLGHGIAPYRHFVGADLKVGLGTDSVVSNNSHDLIEEARFASLLDRAQGRAEVLETPRLSASHWLESLTLGGARALGLDREIGSLVPGKQADLIAIDLSRSHTQPPHDPNTAVLFSLSGRDVVWAMVAGTVLYEDARITTLDEEQILRAARGWSVPGS